MKFKVSLEWETEVEAESEDEALDEAQKELIRLVRGGGPFDCYTVTEIEEEEKKS